VTSLFCDLVGFTASSEAVDPEDVDQMLAAYSAMAQAQIEGHGGVMEKFIGDAVVGVCGAPVAHEDDPERAVRAGLRIVEGAAELEGSVGRRCGCGSGSTPARRWCVSARAPLRGSVCSPATRSTLPHGSSRLRRRWGVAVGLATYETTAVVFD
jgi:class 3 adenylate cyclase